MKHRVASAAVTLAGLLAVNFLLMQFVPGGPVEGLIRWAEDFGRPVPAGPLR